MSEFFVKSITSSKADWLQEHYPSAFLLLSHIARHCRKSDSIPDGLLIGDCIIGEIETSRKCGLSEKEFRNARDKLIKFGYIEIVYHPKPKKTVNGVEIIFVQKRAIKRAIKSMVVNICDSDIYDIRFNKVGDQKGDIGANKGRPEVDKQRTEQNVFTKEQTEQQEPLVSVGFVGSVVFSEEIKNKFTEYDFLRANRVMEEAKKAGSIIRNPKRYISDALEKDWCPKELPPIELSEYARKNKDLSLKFCSKFDLEISQKDILILELGNCIKFGFIKIFYETENFGKEFGLMLKNFNLSHLVTGKKNDKIVSLKPLSDISKEFLEDLEVK